MTRAQVEYLLNTYNQDNLAKIFFNNPGLHSVKGDVINYNFDHNRELLTFPEFGTGSDINNYHSGWFTVSVDYANIEGLIFYNSVQAPPPTP